MLRYDVAWERVPAWEGNRTSRAVLAMLQEEVRARRLVVCGAGRRAALLSHPDWCKTPATADPGWAADVVTLASPDAAAAAAVVAAEGPLRAAMTALAGAYLETAADEARQLEAAALRVSEAIGPFVETCVAQGETRIDRKACLISPAARGLTGFQIFSAGTWVRASPSPS